MLLIRRAQPNDAQRLAQVAESTFRETFSGQNTAEDIELHCQRSYGEAIQAREIAAPNRVNLLVEDRETPIGFAQLRWEHVPACVSAKSPGEIQRFYVVKAWHGRGAAQNLMNACIEEIIRRGSDAAWLGVLERNPRAISFYKKLGFEAVGEETFHLGRDPQRVIVMARPAVPVG